MIKRKLNVAHYNFNFFRSRKIPSLYEGLIDSSYDSNIVLTKFKKEKILDKSSIYRIYKIPPYFKLIVDNKKKYKKIELPEIDKGLLIKLNEFSTINDYLNKQFNAKKRKQINSSIRKLETCFNVTYKIYYGDIRKPEYNFLLEKAQKFITERFNQIGKKHYHLNHWESIEKSLYDLILQKKASIFVIYDNDKPINICFNYHFNNIIVNAIASYDTDYNKFSLGTIDLYRQIEWSITNNYNIFDMMMGESEYKFKWCNSHYNLNHHVILKKGSITGSFIGFLLVIYLKLKRKIFRLAYANPKNKILKLLLPKSNQVTKQSSAPIFETKIVSGETFETKKNDLINFENDHYKFLRKPIYEFLYSNFESKDSISVYKLISEERSYIIKGKDKQQKIIIPK